MPMPKASDPVLLPVARLSDPPAPAWPKATGAAPGPVKAGEEFPTIGAA